MIRRAHSIDVELCADETCGLVHISFSDENDEVFAEAVLNPARSRTEDFVDTLRAVCFLGRLRRQKPKPKLAAH
jgi:hypothetical protein